MTPIEHDPDIDQAQVFLHLLNTEIDVLTAGTAGGERPAGATFRGAPPGRPAHRPLSETSGRRTELTRRHPDVTAAGVGGERNSGHSREG